MTPSVIAAHAQATADHHQAVARAYGIPLRRVAPGPRSKAIRAPVDDIATRTVAFTPTVVSLRAAKLAGDRIYLLLMFADRGGEEGV